MKKLKMKYARMMFLYYWGLSKCFVKCGGTRLFVYFARRSLFYLRWRAELIFENEEES